MKKGSKLYSIFRFKCPQCHEGEFLETRNVYNLKKAGNLKERCSECGCKYSKEPGFYYGAMYVSYAFGVALWVATWVATSVLWPDYPAWFLILLIVVEMVVLGPYLYALSKITWANLFISYKGGNSQKRASESESPVQKV